MKIVRRPLLHIATAAIAFVALPQFALAQDWPKKPIRVIATQPPGSVVDIVPRLVFDQLSKQLGQAIEMENLPGAGSTLAVGTVAKAAPDGYTLLANSSAHTVAQWLYPNLAYDTARDLSGIVALGSLPNVIIGSPARGLKTIREFVATARSTPGTFSYASTGVGTATHMSAERFRVSARIRQSMYP